ncbi:Trypanosoma vivax [Trypanosoma theileri]|uniref:Trypanosoma vivax n=1 Tax=Trypanosoma theileri TaxID=67003 RepID=A0A1X0NWP8_9TRYP|nr:Trypanosoma vivax [Trypanosoma theileri]ORC89102.1 Trypanosoma vivax [Trypanosoma theileri]
MNTTGNEKHYVQTLYLMGEPEVCAIYPTCVLICWDPPRVTNACVEIERVMQWTYTIDWRTNHSLDKEYSSITTALCHAIIEIFYPNEIIYVRICATGTVSGEVVAFGSTKCSIDASVTIPMPWMHSHSMQCRCIFDGLLLSANGAQCVDAFPSVPGSIKVMIASTRMLESSFACLIVKIVYEVPPLPITSSTVYYFIICSKSLVKQRERLRHYSIQEILEKEKASAIFCGIGEMGSSAALAAHLFISSVSDKSNSLRERVFCIAYGSPRRMFLEDSLMLVSSSAFSGNFLYYTGLLVAADPSCGYSNVLFPSHDVKEKQKSDHSSNNNNSNNNNRSRFRFNIPLGIRCGPLLDLKSGKYFLRTQCSGLETLSEEEHHERLDIFEHLLILSQLIFPTGEVQLSPVINTLDHTLEDGVVVCLSIKGSNLQYRPHMCVSTRSGWPVNVSVTSVNPRHVTATFSLVEIMYLESSVRHKPLKRLQIDIAFLTDVGYTSFENYTIKLPGDISEILFFQTQKKLPSSWLFSQPMNLIDNAIVIEPFLTTTKIMETRGIGFTPQISTYILGEIATIAELTNHYIAKKQSVNILTFVANVAAKVSNSGMPQQAMTPMNIQIPPRREATLFEKVLGEYVISKKRTVSTLLSKLTSWKQKLQQGLPWLNDAKYVEKLRLLLSIFDKIPPSRDIPIVSLELSLLTHLLQYLRNTCGVTNINHLKSLHQIMSFEAFYQQVHPLFLASIPASENAAIEILLESAALWTVCLIFHLRSSYLFMHLVAVTGCPGSGCTTICNTIAHLSAEEKYTFKLSERLRNVVIRRTAEYELDDLKEVLILGLSATVIVVGEFADIKGLGYKATWSSIERSLRNNKKQQILTFLSKVDELVVQCSQRDISVGKDPVCTLCEKAVALATKLAGTDAPKELVAVSFAPSVSFLKASVFLQESGISADEFARKLLDVSLSKVRGILANIRQGSRLC